MHFNAFSCHSVDPLFPCRLLLLRHFDSIVLACSTSKLLFHRQTVANARSKNALRCACWVTFWKAIGKLKYADENGWFFCFMKFIDPPMGISSSSLSPSKPEIDGWSWRSLIMARMLHGSCSISSHLKFLISEIKYTKWYIVYIYVCVCPYNILKQLANDVISDAISRVRSTSPLGPELVSRSLLA